MPKIADIMKTDPQVLDPEAKIEHAWKLMHDHRIRHLPVCKGDRLVGLVTQKDLLVNSQNASILSLPIAEIMVFKVDTISPSDSVQEIAQRMLERKISCMPVVEDGNLIGIVTDSDFLSLVASGNV